MLIKMKRTQRTELGMLRAGVAYDIDEEAHKELLNRLLNGEKFAKKTTQKSLKKAAANIAAREKAQMAGSEDGAVEPVLSKIDTAELKAMTKQCDAAETRVEELVTELAAMAELRDAAAARADDTASELVSMAEQLADALAEVEELKAAVKEADDTPANSDDKADAS